VDWARFWALLPAGAIGAILALILLAGCASNPSSGGSSVVVGSQGREVEIGNEMHAQMMAEGAAYDDPELQAYVNRVGQRLVTNSDKPNMKFTFTVIDSPDINAFALPGGYIYMNRGLLSYLDSEAEMAGVLAHEIGHITGRHHGRRQTADITNKVIATTAYILTGSGDLADASQMYGAELVSGYGRDMELEADGLGAEYMYKSGYDPDALLAVIGVLKDQEQFQRVKAKTTGRKVGTYHGLYATHPRNDQRLKTVIRAANELETDEHIENPEVPGEFRAHMEGLVWGASVQDQRAENRYFHNKLAFTFEHPPEWNMVAGSKSIVASAPDGSASLTVTLRRRDAKANPRSVLEGSAGGTLSVGKELEQAGLKGYSAVASNGTDARRLAVIDYNNLSYMFEGKASDFATMDATLLTMIESFRPMHPKERSSGTPRYVHYIQVPRGATMASLAASTRIPNAEAQLRLLNGLYPRGEPRTGDWIKIIR
jgi:predicted Zn-dependent protease